MSRKQRIEITVETAQILVLRCHTVRMWCHQCAAQVERLTVEDAAVAAGVSLPTLYRRAEAGLLHFIETEPGQRFICLNSLLNSISEGETL